MTKLNMVVNLARDYIEKCEAIRRESLLANTERRGASFHAASEGICAARIIGGL